MERTALEAPPRVRHAFTTQEAGASGALRPQGRVRRPILSGTPCRNCVQSDLLRPTPTCYGLSASTPLRNREANETLAKGRIFRKNFVTKEVGAQMCKVWGNLIRIFSMQ